MVAQEQTTGKKERLVTSNRKARHHYEILDTFEAGLVLQGTEVKSLRDGKCNLGDAYAMVRDDELYLEKMHISAYEQGNQFNHEPLRSRKLLMHRREIRRLIGKIREKGLTLIPLRVYFKGPHAKVELALARGKKLFDKREAIAKRETEREVQRSTFRRR